MDIWEQVDAAKLQIGDEVRVARSAYRSYDIGRLHNGRLCKVTGFAHGDVIVSTIDDRVPVLEKVHHPSYNLERKAQK